MNTIFITQNSYFFIHRNFNKIFNQNENIVIFVKEKRRGILKKYLEIIKSFNIKNFITIVILEIYYLALFLKKKNKYKTIFVNDYEINNLLESILKEKKDFRKIISIGCPCKLDIMLSKKYTIDMINLHGGILPLQKGRFSPIKSLNSNHKLLGATLHKVDKNFDEGEILSQITFKVENKNKLLNYHKVIKNSSKLLQLFLQGKTLKPNIKNIFDMKY